MWYRGVIGISNIMTHSQFGQFPFLKVWPSYISVMLTDTEQNQDMCDIHDLQRSQV